MNNTIQKEIKGFKILIDEEDLHTFNSYAWYVTSGGYLATKNKTGLVKQTILYFHRHILGIKDRSISIDHINQNKLDNRKENLRLCSVSQNTINQKKILKTKSTSIYKGVSWSKKGSKWIAAIALNNKSIYLLSCADQHACAYAYNVAAQLLHKEFAYLNSIPAELLGDKQKLAIENTVNFTLKNKQLL